MQIPPALISSLYPIYVNKERTGRALPFSLPPVLLLLLYNKCLIIIIINIVPHTHTHTTSILDHGLILKSLCFVGVGGARFSYK